MDTLPVTLVLAGAAAIYLVLISFPIANRRRATQLSAGDGGDEKFNRLIRAQANFAEYTPLAIGCCTSSACSARSSSRGPWAWS